MRHRAGGLSLRRVSPQASAAWQATSWGCEAPQPDKASSYPVSNEYGQPRDHGKPHRADRRHGQSFHNQRTGGRNTKKHQQRTSASFPVQRRPASTPRNNRGAYEWICLPLADRYTVVGSGRSTERQSESEEDKAVEEESERANHAWSSAVARDCRQERGLIMSILKYSVSILL